MELGYEVNWGVFFSFLFHCNPISAHWVAFESDDWSSIWEFCLDVSILILMMYYDLMTHLWSNVSCTIPARHHCPNRIILCSNSGIYEWLLWPLISNHSLLFIYLFFHVLVVMRDWGWGPYICWSQRTTVQKRIKKKREEKMKKSSHDQYSKTISYHCFLLWSLKIQFVGSKWRVFALAH